MFPRSPLSKSKTSVPISEASKTTSGTNAVANIDLPVAPIAEGVTTRASSAAVARQEAMFQEMQARTAMLESSLKVAQHKLNEHESASHAQNKEVPSIASVPSDRPADGAACPSTRLPTSHPPFLELQPPIATSAVINVSTVPLRSLNATRYSPYTTIRYSPLLYTSAAAVSTVGTATNNMYTSSVLPPHDPAFYNFSSAAPIPANMGSIQPQMSCQSRKLQDLPEFCGKPEEWPIFFTAFTESTAVYGYSYFENNLRLQKCLKGEVRETIKSLLIHPNNVNIIIEQLKFRFGRPEQLIRSQLAQVREIAPISEGSMTKLIPFATKVNNVCAFLHSAYGGDQHIANPTLFDELIAKLPMSKRIEWAVFAASLHPYATVTHFSEWLTKLANVICTVYDGDATRDSKRRVVLHAAESQRKPRCPTCQGQHKLAECKQFSELLVSKRWAEVKRCHLCFACLNVGHGTRNFQQRKPNATDGCKRMHHKLLHEAENSCVNSPIQSTLPQERVRRLPTSEQRKGSNILTQPAIHSQQQNYTGAAVLSCSNGTAVNKILFRILPVVLYANQKCVETYAPFELGLHGRNQRLNLQWFGGRAGQEPAVAVDLLISGAGMQKKHKLRNVYGVSNLQ
ncbi:PREDICTED: uncharacterized protein LOC108366556 [Rhagoletis zephyria]|uniref:uncharacterized protein LOC108366556 n=1 Tax=Rhagoletis zephyria TaxID=28612 RepID=UPI00081177D7|nr:PREDICTED: uncharacterized protein LOC108366556 [Rhagoletis zephyria]